MLIFRGGGGVPFVAPSVKLRNVATKINVGNAILGSAQQWQSRSPHFMRASGVTQIAVVIPNFISDFHSTPTEFGPGAPTTFTAAIEYPSSTFTQLKFGGFVSGTAGDNSFIATDLANLSIPLNALFWVRIFGSNSIAFPILDRIPANTVNGEATHYGVTVADQTMGGTVTNTNSVVTFHPVAVVSPVSIISPTIIGDSRGVGYLDTFGANNDLGGIARSIGPSLPYMNLSSYGEDPDQLLVSCTNRLALLKTYGTSVVFQAGINGIIRGDSLALAEANAQAFAALCPGHDVFYTTLPPVGTSSNSFVDVPGQTTNVHNATRAAYNNDVRALAFGGRGFFEVADPVESSRDSGLWQVNGTPFKYTGDGTHESAFGYLTEQTSGNINPGILT